MYIYIYTMFVIWELEFVSSQPFEFIFLSTARKSLLDCSLHSGLYTEINVLNPIELTPFCMVLVDKNKVNGGYCLFR